MARLNRSDSYGLRRTCVKLGVLALFVSLWVLALTPTLHAAIFTCSDTACLIDSINQANATPRDADTIYLMPGRYILREANNSDDGRIPPFGPNATGGNGLPVISTEITIVGIQESDGTRPSISRAAGPSFRIFYLRLEGKLSLYNLIIDGGFAESPSDDAAGRGGAIFVEEVASGSRICCEINLDVGNVVFASNRASSNGGAIFIGGVQCCTIVAVRDSIFFNNQALRGSGGGIYWNNFRLASSEPLRLVKSTFERNIAVNGNGGGLYVPNLDIGNDIIITPVGVRGLFRETACSNQPDDNCTIFIFDGSEAAFGADFCSTSPAHCP
jgi:predicted outer membrane repeat protein